MGIGESTDPVCSERLKKQLTHFSGLHALGLKFSQGLMLFPVADSCLFSFRVFLLDLSMTGALLGLISVATQFRYFWPLRKLF